MLKDVHIPSPHPTPPPTHTKDVITKLFLPRAQNGKLYIYVDIASHIGRNNQLDHPCGKNE